MSKGKTKGKGLPPPGETGIREDHTVNTHPSMRARQASRGRTQQPLFGRRTKNPARSMLGNVILNPESFVTKCHENSLQVANIKTAFKGHGPLLLHVCVTETKSDEKKKRRETNKEKKEFIKVVRGIEAGAIDRRRLPLERGMMSIGRCEPCCAGLGLVLPAKTAPCWAAHKLAFCFASLNFDGFLGLCNESEFDPTLFPMPTMEFTEVEEKSNEQLAIIESQLMSPDERQQLRNLAAEGRIEDLEVLERKLLPMAYVPDLTQKVKLFCLNNEFKHLEVEVTEDFGRVMGACDAVRKSRRFLDVLSVILQISNYLGYFGETESEGRGFSLLNLNAITDYRLGKYTLLLMVCIFLMNLRPGGEQSRKPPTRERSSRALPSPRRASSRDPSLGRNTEGFPAQRTSPPDRLRNSSPRPSVGRIDRRDDSMVTEQSFLDSLESELALVRDVISKRDRLKPTSLMSHSAKFRGMAQFVEGWLHGEVVGGASAQQHLFDPPRQDVEAELTPRRLAQARFAELTAWVEGRRQLEDLLQRINNRLEKLKVIEEKLRAGEVLLKEFAALNPNEVEGQDYMKIFDIVATFMDRLKQRWTELGTSNCGIHIAPLRALLAAEPLGMISAKNCLPDIFDLWRAAAERPMRTWESDVRKKALDHLFHLFDLDGNEKVDAEELRVTLGAFGIVLPKEGPKAVHFDFVQLFDSAKTGTLTQEDFERFVENRMDAAFRLFLDPENPAATMVSRTDLQRIASQMRFSHDEVADNLERMIHCLDDGGRDDGLITRSKFEQIILMPGEIKGSDVQSWGVASPTALRMRSDNFWLAADNGGNAIENVLGSRSTGKGNMPPRNRIDSFDSTRSRENQRFMSSSSMHPPR